MTPPPPAPASALGPLRGRLFREWLLVAVVASLFVGAAAWNDWLRRADSVAYDAAMRVGAALLPRAPDDRIVLVAIDDGSVAELGAWPWPRQRHAALLRRLAAAGADTVVYDVLFVEPSADPAADAALAAAMRGVPTVLPLLMEVPGRDGAAATLVEPVAPLRDAAAAVGHVNLAPDFDGVARRAFMTEGVAGDLRAHVAALAVCRLDAAACRTRAADDGAPGLHRLDPLLPKFSAARDQFRTVPFAAAMRGEVPPEVFRGKLVFVGATAAGLGDAYATPMARRGELMPGVELNAAVADALLSGRTVRPLGPEARTAAALLPLWLLLTALLFARPGANLWLSAAIAAGALLTSMAAMPLLRVWAPPAAALAGIAVVFPLWGWRRLAATSGWMRAELARFRAARDELAPRRRVGDAVEDEADMLSRTIARVRELRGFIADTLDGLPDATLVIEADGAVRLTNGRARALLGDDLAGRPFADALRRLDPALADCPAGGGPSELSDQRGRTFDLLWSPVREADAQVWVLRLADITPLRTAERQREEALQLLSHDMRSPQAAIIATLEQADVPDALKRRLEGYARRTLELSDGFVQLARADSQTIGWEPLNLSDCLVEAADDLWPLANRRAIRIVTRGVEEEALVTGDRGLLNRAVGNLLGNAVKYSPDGSTIECAVERDGGRWACVIADQGPGLSAEQLAALFQPFRRFASDREGAGLGLVFVERVAARHGGSVDCVSTPGRGATFTLRLPAADEASAS